jgi:UDP-N-acetylmuramoylalanine--D-glutamate ligase
VKIADLRDKSILIVGLGQEGRSTLRFLRSMFPDQMIGVADQLPLERLSTEARALLESDAHVERHLGPRYLAGVGDYDVIIKSPGIPLMQPAFKETMKVGKIVTSQTALFFDNFSGKVVGITGTKGKSTTASLIHAIAKRRDPGAAVIGNIGTPALDALPQLQPDAPVIYELSSHQLEGLSRSPHIAILLNIVPEHLDYYASFEQYAGAKANITRSQTTQDFLIYDADHEAPRRIAAASRAARLGCSLEIEQYTGCYVADDWITFRVSGGQPERIISASEVPLPGRFNLINVAAAVAAGKLLGVASGEIGEAIRKFRPLEHRLEWVGVFGGVTYYNDSIATVPEATIAALDTLGDSVETLLLGGTDRHLDFASLARRIASSSIKTLILFPATGERVWKVVVEQDAGADSRMRRFFVETMEEAVALAKQHTASGKICLLSPASPSFGLFRDYRERGARFKEAVLSAK